jgi:2'-5' RNA ligase
MTPLVRAIVAIKIPLEFGLRIQEIQMNIRRKAMSDQVRWNQMAEIMLPILAMGEQPPERVIQATTVIGPICRRYQPFRIRLEGLIGLPNNTQPRYVGFNVTGDVEQLCLMREEIARACAPIVPLTEKQYHPHVDLGRLKLESEQARSGLGRAVKLLQSESVGEWTATTLEILRAGSGTMGVSYDTVQSLPIGDA